MIPTILQLDPRQARSIRRRNPQMHPASFETNIMGLNIFFHARGRENFYAHGREFLKSCLIYAHGHEFSHARGRTIFEK